MPTAFVTRSTTISAVVESMTPLRAVPRKLCAVLRLSMASAKLPSPRFVTVAWMASPGVTENPRIVTSGWRPLHHA